MRSKPKLPPGKILYLILDRAFLGDYEVGEAVREAARGGVNLVQYRDKLSSSRELLRSARRLLKVLNKYNIPLIIDDRLDISLAAGAQGVHLGQDDLPVAAARRLGGERLIIGASARTVEQAQAAERSGADYLGVGSFFPTATKTGAPLVDRKLFPRIVKSIKIPVIAIGGINEENLIEAFNAGASGVAVASAIFRYDTIEKSVCMLKRRIEKVA